jgi:hypothetical protein
MIDTLITNKRDKFVQPLEVSTDEAARRVKVPQPPGPSADVARALPGRLAMRWSAIPSLGGTLQLAAESPMSQFSKSTHTSATPHVRVSWSNPTL